MKIAGIVAVAVATAVTIWGTIVGGLAFIGSNPSADELSVGRALLTHAALPRDGGRRQA